MSLSMKTITLPQSYIISLIHTVENKHVSHVSLPVCQTQATIKVHAFTQVITLSVET